MRFSAAITVLLGLVSSASADLIASWNFSTFDGQGYVDSNFDGFEDTPLAADGGGSGLLSLSDGLNSPPAPPPGGTPDVAIGAGTTLNEAAVDALVQSLRIFRGPGPGAANNNGQYFDLIFSKVGMHSISLTYAAMRDAGGFSSNVWTYSVDNGSTFNPFTNPINNLPINPNIGSYGLVTLDLSSEAAINSQANVILRNTLGGGTVQGGSIQIDNIQISGVPEPASMAMLGTGVLGFFLLRRRNRNRV